MMKTGFRSAALLLTLTVWMPARLAGRSIPIENPFIVAIEQAEKGNPFTELLYHLQQRTGMD